MSGKYAVIGLGRFGKTLATTLSQKGAEVLAIDTDPDKVEDIKDEVAHAVRMDSRDVKALKSQRIEDFDVIIVAIGSDFESMLLTTVSLMNMEVKHVIARAMNKTQRIILEKLGVQDIISPEIQVAIDLAERLLQPKLKTFMKLADDYEIAEVTVSNKLANQSLIELDLRKKFNINAVAIERLVSQSLEGEKKKQHKV